MLDGERLEIGRDWLASAQLTDAERLQILGADSTQQAIKQDEFNLVASYLHQEVGLPEEELSEWFRWNMRADLNGQTPFEAWQESDGFERVFAAAQAWQVRTAEDLGEDDRQHEGTTMHPTSNEQANMQEALDVFRDAFKHCGIELDNEEPYLRAGVWNNNETDAFFIQFIRDDSGLESYKVGIADSTSCRQLCLLTWQPPGEERQIVRGSTGEFADNGASELEKDVYQCDLDPFPKRADAQPFVRRLQECITANTLISAGQGTEV